MIRHIHHPSCPAGHLTGASCICPTPKRRTRRTAAAESLAFAAMLAAVVAVPLYALWQRVA